MMGQPREKIGLGLVLLIGGIMLVGLLFIGPLPQDVNYHHFADQRTWWEIPNTWNVLSNLPFFVVGLMGWGMLTLRTCSLNISPSDRWAWRMFFLGIALVGVGSGYYHWFPDNMTLVWDRLPMTLAFMSLYSIIISEFISEKAGKYLLVPLLIMGGVSVWYWWMTESEGQGDLRGYVMVQFLPMLTIPVILICFQSKWRLSYGYWVLLLAYVVAKGFEFYDQAVYDFLGGISGHSVKHIVPVLGIGGLMVCLKKRTLRA